MSDLQYFQNIPIERLREQVIEQLKGNYAHNNIVIEEFERRLEIATALEDRYELLKVVQDLPVVQSSGGDPDLEWSRQAGNITLNLGRVREEDSMVAIFSGVDRKGLWRPARSSKLLALFGGMDIDYSRAYMPPGETYVGAMCVFGGVDMIVPEGLNVEVHGVPLFGGIENKTTGEYIPGAPTLHIRAFVLFGGLEIKHKKKRWRR
ncbi:MAG: LiaF-related protein [Spirochaetota bacterium]|nr:LiaF-related protein [Spirochaetota bacterium]